MSELTKNSRCILLLEKTYEKVSGFNDADVKINTSDLFLELLKQAPDSDLTFELLYDYLKANEYVQVNHDGKWFWIFKYRV